MKAPLFWVKEPDRPGNGLIQKVCYTRTSIIMARVTSLVGKLASTPVSVLDSWASSARSQYRYPALPVFRYANQEIYHTLTLDCRTKEYSPDIFFRNLCVILYLGLHSLGSVFYGTDMADFMVSIWTRRLYHSCPTDRTR